MPSKNPTPDRRIARTHDALREALIELILEKGYDATTVSEVVDRANVARSTFYAHHSGKESLLLDGIGKLREHLVKASQVASGSAGEQGSRLAFSLALFEHADSQRDLYQAHKGDQSGPLVIDALRQMLTRLIRHEMQTATTELGSVPKEAMIRFTTEALLAVLTWWMETKPHLSPVEGNRIFRQLIERGIAAGNLTAPQAPTK